MGRSALLVLGTELARKVAERLRLGENGDREDHYGKTGQAAKLHAKLPLLHCAHTMHCIVAPAE
jgi:hypothetical protein